MQLELLWNYMQYDMEADRFENAMRNAPDRLKLLKQRDFLLEQQNNVKRIERETAAMSDRLEAVRDEAKRLQGLLDNLLKSLEENPPETLEDIEKQVAAAQKLEDSLQHYEQELNKMRKDSDQRDRLQKDIRLRYARTKAEYDELKKTYEVDFGRDKVKLAELKARAEKEAANVDAGLMGRYREVKQHVTPPIAQLNGNRCGCCNMSMPAAVMNEVGSGKLVECDNCGRILYVAAE